MYITRDPPIPTEIGESEERSAVANLKRWASKGTPRPFYLRLRDIAWSWRLLLEFVYDLKRFSRYSSAVQSGNTREKLKALLTMAYHSLEKGLSLKAPKPGFGQKHARTLMARLQRYLAHCGTDEHCIVAFNVLHSYAEFNRKNGISLSWLNRQLEDLRTKLDLTATEVDSGGVKSVTKTKFMEGAKKDLTDFFESRHSVRQYSPEPVDVCEIEHAVKLAQKTPSVCNRQSARVWLINTPLEVQDALALQDGARGFSEEVGTVLVITSDLAAFQSAGERYQCWIDGGLFAMSLIYALHSLGLVTCCLNWSKTHEVDVRFKERFKIPHAESIIMLLSVGHPIDNFRVAHSWRKPLSEVLRTVPSK